MATIDPVTRGPGRPRKPAGHYDTITVKPIPGDKLKRCRARTECWDIDGNLRNVTAVSPYAEDSKGRYLPDRNGNRARAEVERKCKEYAQARRDSTLTPYSYLQDLWQMHRKRLVDVDGAAGNTLEIYDRTMRDILKLFPRLQLIQIDTDRVAAILLRLGQEHGIHAVGQAHAVLSGMFEIAERKIHKPNPVKLAPKFYASVQPKGRVGGSGIPDEEMMQRINTAIHTDYTTPCPQIKGTSKGKRAVPSIAQYCKESDLLDVFDQAMLSGHRPSQLMGLRISDLDLENLDSEGRGSIKPGYGSVTRAGGKVEWHPAERPTANPKRKKNPKNASQETILSAYMVQVYRRRIIKLKKRGLALGRPVVLGGFDENGVPLDLLYPNPSDGLLRSPAYLSEQWKRVAVAMGLPDDITFYSFRHGFADGVKDELGAQAAADGIGHVGLTNLKNYTNAPKANPDVATVMDRRIRGAGNR